MAVLLIVIAYCIPKYCESYVETVIVENVTYAVPTYGTLGQSWWYWTIYWTVMYTALILIIPLIFLVCVSVYVIYQIKRTARNYERASEVRYNYLGQFLSSGLNYGLTPHKTMLNWSVKT